MSLCCSKCKTEMPVGDFVGKNQRELKTCVSCRDGVKASKRNNKDMINDNNAFHSSKRAHAAAIERAKKPRILARPVDSNGEWKVFATQIELTTAIGAQAANVSRVLSGKASHTAKHNIRYETVEELNAHINESVAGAQAHAVPCTDWKDYQKQSGRVYEHAPSKFRKPHTLVDSIWGKDCSHCNAWKPLTGYSYTATHWDQLRVQCKECMHAYRVANTEKMRRYNAEYWKQTKDAQTEAHRKWIENNREHVNAYARAYRPAWERKQRASNPQFKIVKNMRVRLRQALRGHTKSARTFDYIGMDRDQYMEWLEFQFYDGMQWDNYGSHWHIDHMVPCAHFDMQDEEEKRDCFVWWNTRPLVAHKNKRKKDRAPEMFELVLQELKAVFFAQHFM